MISDINDQIENKQARLKEISSIMLLLLEQQTDEGFSENIKTEIENLIKETGIITDELNDLIKDL